MKNKINNIFWWSFLIIYLEIIYKIFVVGNLFTINTLTVLIFSVPWILLISFISSLFNEKVNKIINIVLTIAIVILTLAQIVYYNFYYSIFSLFSLTAGGGGQVIQFVSYIIKVILRIWYIFLIVLIPVILYLILNKKVFKYNKISLKKALFYLLGFNLSFISIIISINISSEPYPLKKLLFETHAPMLTINKTGLLTMEVIDVYRYFNGFDEKINYYDINNNDYKSEEYNVMNINFNKLISKETDNTIINMHNYFKNVKPTPKNEYSGLFKDKNIIYIVAESLDTIAIDEELTPTLYKMANNSFVFNNYYQPLYPISTLDGEYMLLSSLIPKEGVWSLYDSSNNSMPFTYGNSFKKNGYTTYAFHNNVYNFYHREEAYPNIGFNYLACGNGLEKNMNCNNWPNRYQ